jgi:hypothetical protein
MSDEELRARLRDLHDAAKSVVILPGVERAHRTLRRRRVVRAMMASTAVVILGLVALRPSHDPPFPPDVLTPPSSPSPSPSPSESPTPSPAPVTPTSPAGRAQAAGVGLHPFFLEYGSGLSTVVGQDAGFSFPIGVMTWGTGTATGVQVIADLSQLTGSVDIVGVGSPCSQSGTTVTCDFGTLQINGQKKVSAPLTLRGKPGAPAGSAGQVTLRLAARPTHPSASASVRIDVHPSVTDLAITSTVPSARIGQTVTVAHTIRNNGPVPEPWAAVGASAAQPGTAYVGGEGCTFTATTFDCRVENLAVGEARTVRVTVRVDRCPPRWDNRAGGVYTSYALSDPNTFNGSPQVQVRVQGC